MSSETTQTVKPVVITNEKIEQLKADKKAAYVKMQGLEFESPEWLDANLEMSKIGRQIEAEIANVKKAEADARAQELRNQRIALFDTAIDAYAKMQAVNGDKKSTEADKTAATEAFTTARETVVNELLARYPLSTPAKKAESGESKKGGNSEILEQHKANVAAGMTDGQSRTALEKAGFARSTVWHTVNNYNKAQKEAV